MDIKSCSFCSEKAVYRRKYSGESLCTECFKNSIVEKTRKTISKYKMLKYGEKIAIGLSGGKDSSALDPPHKTLCFLQNIPVVCPRRAAHREGKSSRPLKPRGSSTGDAGGSPVSILADLQPGHNTSHLELAS